MDYFERIETILSALSELTGEQATQYLVAWHGFQLLDDSFYKYLMDEGVLPDDEWDE